ncbi:adenylate/guanylate cyclase domain-containing protein [Inquilinus sp. KBS0705]|nr:adenylate/guanylate cyclase domain-containing protein [Inquilinus sp. KBS0705]
MENNYLMLNTYMPAASAVAVDQEKEVAILFLDIRNFTGLMESQPGQSVIQLVRRLYTAFNQIVKNTQGRVIEIAGDNLYAVFGLQSNLRQAVNNAYQAAKLMFQTVDIFNDAYTTFNNDPLEIGVGLHAGKVFVSEFGLDGPAQLSVMGLPVNIAARLQAKTKELNNDLLMSEYAYQMLESHPTALIKQTTNLQGISQGQQVRLAGKPYNNNYSLTGLQFNMDYLLAISG